MSIGNIFHFLTSLVVPTKYYVRMVDIIILNTEQGNDAYNTEIIIIPLSELAPEFP